MPIATVEVTGEILHESPTRLGINVGPNTYYNDQQMVARPLAHGAFPKGRQVGFARVSVTRGNSFESIFSYKTSFRGGTYVVATGASAGQSGAIVEHDPDTGVFTIDPPATDLVIDDNVWLRGPPVSQAVPDPMPGERELGIGDFRVEASDGSDVSVVQADGDANDQAVRMEVLDRDGYAAVKHYFIALPNDEYRVSVRARAESGSGSIGVRLTNYGIPPGQPGHRIFMESDSTELSTEWTDFEFHAETFGDERIRDGFSAVDIRVSGGAAAALIDRVTLADRSIDSGFAFTEGVVETLKEARCGVLRFYGIASLGSLVRDITAGSAEESGWTFTDYQNRFQRHTTHAVVDDWMHLSAEVGAAPWISVGAANTPADWHELISYLAAPADFDDASRRRARHGHQQPWTDSFDTIYLELGNEWWNGIFAPWFIEWPSQYGELCNTVFERVLAHPHFDADRIKLIAGGWAVNGRDWNTELSRASKHHDIISVAPYLAHELNSIEYGSLFADVEGSFGNGGRATVAGIGNKGLAVYELNTHTTGGGIQATGTSLMAPSLGAGVAVLDQAMSCMALWAADPINYFTYFQRSFGSGHSERVGLWGNLILGRDGTHRPRPVWQGLRLANRYVIDGDMVEVHVKDGAMWTHERNGSVPERHKLPYVKAYAFRPGAGSANVLLINRHLQNAARVQVQLPFDAASKVVQAQIAASVVDANNEDYERVVIEEETIDWNGPDTVIELPPHSATALQFRAAD